MQAPPDEVCTKRTVTVARWMLTLVLTGVAAFAFLAYVAQGVAIGSLIGLRGRGQDIATLQHHATLWLAAFVLIQIAAIAALASLLPFASEEKRGVRLAVRSLVAAPLSLAATLLVGIAILGLLRALFRN